MKGTATAFALALAVPAGAQTVPAAPVDQAVPLIGTVLYGPIDRVAELTAVYLDKTAVVRPCPTAPSDEIVVCGSRSKESRYRLPLPAAAIDEDDNGIVPGELPSASSKPIQVGTCGVIQGGNKKPCTRGLNNIREAANILEKLARRLIDPDADVDAPGFLEKLLPRPIDPSRE